MSFHMGSLGFLTPFEFQNFEQQLTHILEGNAALTLRSRLRCIIMKKIDNIKNSENPTYLNSTFVDDLFHFEIDVTATKEFLVVKIFDDLA